MSKYKLRIKVKKRTVMQNEINDELSIYKNDIEFLASMEESFEYNNKGEGHAAIVLATMLNQTKEEFLMFSGELDKDVANQEIFLDALENYLKQNKIFKLLIEQMPKKPSRALILVKKYAKENSNVEYKISDNKVIDTIKDIFDGTLVHFSVSDKKSYRLETDRDKYKAVCNFNDKNIGIALQDVFNDVYSIAK